MGYKVPEQTPQVTKTVRIDQKDLETMKKLAKQNNMSFNKILSSMIRYALENME